MRVAVRERRVEADDVEQLAHARAALAPACRLCGSTSGSATMSPTVMRGSSDECGSWNTICISPAHPPQALAGELRQLLAVEHDRAAVGRSSWRTQ